MSPQDPIPPDLAEWIIRSLDGTIKNEQFALLDREIIANDAARAYYLEFITTYIGIVDLVGVLPNPAEFVGDNSSESNDLSEGLGPVPQGLEYPAPNPPEKEGRGGAIRLGPEISEEERVRQIECYAREQLEKFLEQQRKDRLEQESLRRRRDVPSVMDRMAESAQRFFTFGIRAAKKAALYSLAAMVILILALYLYANRTVGTLVDSVDAKWSGILEDDGRLRSRRLSLEQGYARIRLDRGAEVILQAPTTFTLQTSNRMSLESGWITAKVPPVATGFTIKTPESRVVDFGTEFGLLVGSRANEEVHVFDGRIEYQYGKTSEGSRHSQDLAQGEAATLDEAGQLDRMALKDRPRLFVREIPLQSGFGIPGKRLNLGDMIGGGNGLGTGVLGQGIDPSTGTLTPTRQLVKKAGRGFLTVPSLPFIDGVFVPDGNTGPTVVSSTGIVFEGCPKTLGKCYETIVHGAMFRAGSLDLHLGSLAGRLYGTQASPSIGMHPNAGITFDLGKIRSSMPDVEIDRFKALCGISETVVGYAKRDSDPNAIRVDFWVLVDGRVRFSRTLAVVPLQSHRIDIPLGPNDRFLTLATSNPREYLYCWAMFAEPQLELTAKTKTLEGNTRH